MQRHLTALDQLIINADKSLTTLFGNTRTTGRPYPAKETPSQELNKDEQQHASGLMRINHAGEVAAQGLYQGQALTAKLPEVRQQMERAATEENDHLDWCDQRLQELQSHKSRLTPLWYSSSFTIGALAGLAGDKWSLGFVAETEKQVVKHLEGHFNSLPEKDQRSLAILKQMHADESQHAQAAVEAGGAALPWPVRKLMGLTAEIMTRTAYKW
ncbi:MAG: 2-polyprenyl-3-methyl-6-methoxy-1,4-benzoquinone monooxygenase [Gammaproteobacteria bacterium]|nr:2-polyprenyl-3-methyl-6-methoxy-1,4-benzoquinone monooxygenase [Gammaproteobacteria bacterium]